MATDEQHQQWLDFAVEMWRANDDHSDSEAQIRADATTDWNSWDQATQTAVLNYIQPFQQAVQGLALSIPYVAGEKPGNLSDFGRWVKYEEEVESKIEFFRKKLEDAAAHLLDAFPGPTRAAQDVLEVQLQWETQADVTLNDFREQAKRAKQAGAAARKELGGMKDGSGWVAAADLGRGGYGQAILYVRQNSNGVVVDRLVCKEARVSKSGRTWNAEGTIPYEVMAMFRLNPMAKADRIVRIRHWAMKRKQKTYRIYMEFCAHGSLDSLGQKYAQRGKPREARKWLPEAFLWHVFDSLATAGSLMEGGTSEQTPAGWELILHGDLRPLNVFLGENTTGMFRRYPTAKTGDFGLSTILEKTRPFDFAEFDHSTWRHKAPERIQEYLEGDEEACEYTSKTNVWAVGNTMWSVINGLDGDTALEDDDRQIHVAHLPFDDNTKQRYSSELLNLIKRCYSYLPRDRPSFDELLSEILSHTDGTYPDRADSLRTAGENDKRWAKNALMLGREKFALFTLLEDDWDEEYGDLPKPPASPNGEGEEDHQAGDGNGNAAQAPSNHGNHDGVGVEGPHPPQPRSQHGGKGLPTNGQHPTHAGKAPEAAHPPETRPPNPALPKLKLNLGKAKDKRAVEEDATAGGQNSTAEPPRKKLKLDLGRRGKGPQTANEATAAEDVEQGGESAPKKTGKKTGGKARGAAQPQGGEPAEIKEYPKRKNRKRPDRHGEM